MKTISILEASNLDEAMALYNQVIAPYVIGNIYKVTLTIQIPEEIDLQLEEKGKGHKEEGKGHKEGKEGKGSKEVEHKWW